MNIEAFVVAGKSARTANVLEMGGEGSIPKLWGALGAVEGDIFAVYYDYAGGKDGYYTYILGKKLSPAEEVPPGMVTREVVGGEYSKFSGSGPDPKETVIKLWHEIWSLEKTGLRRAFRTDFEVYHPNGEIDIYIGVLV